MGTQEEKKGKNDFLRHPFTVASITAILLLLLYIFGNHDKNISDLRGNSDESISKIEQILKKQDQAFDDQKKQLLTKKKQLRN